MKLKHIKNYLKDWAKLCCPPVFFSLTKRLCYISSGASPMKDIQFLLPKLSLKEIYSGIEFLEVVFPVSQIYNGKDKMVLTLVESLTLASICKYIQPNRIFEIGTYTGLSSLIMAMNTPSKTEIFTLDLEPSDRYIYKKGLNPNNFPEFMIGSFYRNTPFEKKIHQLLGNSLHFDFSPFFGTVDVVFIDADHTFEFVKSDTENAFKLLRPGGVIIWDDYLWDMHHPECVGVTTLLNYINESKTIFQITGTRLAIYVDSV